MRSRCNAAGIPKQFVRKAGKTKELELVPVIFQVNIFQNWMWKGKSIIPKLFKFIEICHFNLFYLALYE
jgi:hypothetical protein